MSDDLEPGEKKRTIFWLDGRREVVRGKSLFESLFTGGLFTRDLNQMDFIADGDNNDYEYKGGHWIKKAWRKLFGE